APCWGLRARPGPCGGMVLSETSPAEVERLARSLSASETGAQLTVDVQALDNSPDRRLEPVMTALLGPASYSWSGSNRGYGAAHNQGMRTAFSAGSDAYHCRNPAVVLHPRALDDPLSTSIRPQPGRHVPP